MIRSPGVNAVINDLIDRLRKNPNLPQEIGNKYLLQNSNQVTVYDFSRNSGKDGSAQSKRSTGYESSGSDSSGYQLTHLDASMSNQPHQEFIGSAYQQHSKLLLNSEPFQPTDVDYLHSNQIFLPPTFNITHQSLEVMMRQGAILSYYQSQAALFAKEVTEILPHLDIILSTPSIAASTTAPPYLSTTQAPNRSGWNQSGFHETNTFSPPQSQLPISLTPLLYQAHIILTYTTLKAHIFYYFEQIGFCRDKFICHLRHDSVRTELYELISHDFRKLEEFVIKLKDFHSFCLHAAVFNNDELITSITSQQQIQQQLQLQRSPTHSDSSASSANLRNSLQSLRLTDSTALSDPQLKPVILFPPIYASKDQSAPLFYNLEIVEPTSSKFYEELGILLELRYELITQPQQSGVGQTISKPSPRYQIIFKNVGNYSIRVSQALFTLLDSSCFQPTTSYKSAKSPDSSSSTQSYPSMSDSLSPTQQPPPPPPPRTRRITSQPPDDKDNQANASASKSRTYNTPPGQNAHLNDGNVVDDDDLAEIHDDADEINNKHPLLRNDWLDLVHVNKPLTPLPQRRQNLLASQRVTNIADIQPSFICFSFDPPNNYRPPQFQGSSLEIDSNEGIFDEDIVLPHPYSYHHKNYPAKLLKLQQMQSKSHPVAAGMHDFLSTQDEKADDSGESGTTQKLFQSTPSLRKQIPQQRYLSCSFLIEIINPLQ